MDVSNYDIVGHFLTTDQVQQIVDKTIAEGDKDGDDMLSYAEFCDVCAICYVDVPYMYIDITT